MVFPIFPLRMNLQEITIEQLDISSTEIDSDFREPLQQKTYGPPIVLSGQVNMGSKEFEARERSRYYGDYPVSTPHLVFKREDLIGLGVTLQKGDRVIEIDAVPMNLLIDEVRFESPLSAGGPGGVPPARFILIYAMLRENLDVH